MDAENADEGGQRSNAAEAEPPEPDAGAEASGGDRVEVDLAAPIRARVDLVPSWLVDQIGRVLDVLDRETTPRCGRVSVRVVDDAEMDAAHRRYSGVEGTTDVLTFVGDEDEGLGVDVFVCIDEATRRAEEFGHPVDRELLLYAVHGILHAIGHDDHEPEAHALMHAEEDRLLRAIGIGPVYRPGADA
jgi:probable rRNA maturation factor